MKSFITLFLCFLSCQFFFAKESEITVYNEQSGIKLAGTLAVPDTKSPKALFVFASGSGAQNRDEEIMGLRPFKVLSDVLINEGYGVLRMDDRGVGQSEGVFETATLADFTSDAVSAVKHLKNLYPDIRVGILGHSQGGQVAVRAAANNNADFIVTLAGPAWSGDSLVMSQCRALAVATTGSWPNESLERKLLDIAKSNIPDFTVRILLTAELSNTLGDIAKMPQVQEQIYNQISPLVTPMYRDLLRYNPADDISSVKVPWLALNGDKDLQVLVKNLETIKDLNPNAVTVIIPDHNHLFQPAITGLPTEYPIAGQSPSDMTIEILVNELNKLLIPE